MLRKGYKKTQTRLSKPLNDPSKKEKSKYSGAQNRERLHGAESWAQRIWSFMRGAGGQAGVEAVV